MSRHFTPRPRQPHRRYSYDCYECGAPIFDEDDDYYGQAIADPDFKLPDVLSGLYALTPAETPFLSMLNKDEPTDFTWDLGANFNDFNPHNHPM